MKEHGIPLMVVGPILGALGCANCFTMPAVAETPSDMLAAQIRIQGFACDNPQKATRDRKRSKPDHEVWVLQCGNATYRISRYPDMAARVEKLK
jgi:hypothetical protein